MPSAPFVGWIQAPREDAEKLAGLGFVVDLYDEQSGAFLNVGATAESIDKLKPFWNKPYLWGFSPQRS